jgi:tetratricopeptide (TPR) repeat protein
MNLIFFIGTLLAQPYHYPFGFDVPGLSRIDTAFFDEIEKDIGRSLTFNNASKEYTYIQHLKNVSVFDAYGKIRDDLNEEAYYLHLNNMINQFPTQTSGYYWLARFYMDKGDVNKSLDLMRKASTEFNISPQSFSHLTQLYSKNSEFINGYNSLEKYYKGVTTFLSDRNWIALYDSIKQQDQLYRAKYRLDDPRFEPQYKIDEQNALFLRELVHEYGWFSKYLGRDYYLVETPVVHFAIEHQLYFLDYIIADCMSYQARWSEAEAVVWKIINHTSRIIVNDQSYHGLPLMCIDPLSGILDLEQSMLTIRSAVLAMFGCGANRSDIWLIATSELSETNYIESLEVIKKYLVLLGLDGNKIHIQRELLENDIENRLILKTPVVLKLKL